VVSATARTAARTPSPAAGPGGDAQVVGCARSEKRERRLIGRLVTQTSQR